MRSSLADATGIVVFGARNYDPNGSGVGVAGPFRVPYQWARLSTGTYAVRFIGGFAVMAVRVSPEDFTEIRYANPGADGFQYVIANSTGALTNASASWEVTARVLRDMRVAV